MAQTPAGTADPVRVRHYVEIVAFCAHECAETRAGPHEIFLWNARRLSEALLYALAEGTEHAAQTKPLQGRPMDHSELIRKLVAHGRLPSQLVGFFDILRNGGNVGAHTHGPDNVADTATLDACRRAVIAVTRWFYYDSLLAEPMPVAVSDGLRDLETEQARTPRPHRVEMEMRKLRREIEHLKSQLSPELSMLGTDGGERQGPQRRRAARMRVAALVGVLVLGLLVGWIAGSWSAIYEQDDTASLAHVPTDPRLSVMEAPLPVQPPQALQAEQPLQAGPSLQAAALSAASTIAVPADDEGGGAGGDAVEPGRAAAAPIEATVAVASADPREAAPSGDAAQNPKAAPAVVADPETARAGCPASSFAIAGRKLSLAQGPNPRPNWPQPEPTPPATTIATFCMDRAPVAARLFDAWLQARSDESGTSKRRRRQRAAAQGAESQPATLLTWAEASAYCTEHQGTLASSVQWEAALRRNPAPRLLEGVGEWVLDTFPPVAFGYASEGAGPEHMYFKEHLGGKASSRKPLLSWQRGKAVRRGSAALSFRCVYAP